MDDIEGKLSSKGVSKRKVWHKCCVCRATTLTHPDRRYFRFPRDPVRCREWTSILRKVDLASHSPNALYARFRVCSSHFGAKAYATSRRIHLAKNAVPDQPPVSPQISAMASSLKGKLDSTQDEAPELVVADSYATPRRGLQRLRLLTPKSKKIKSLATKLYFLKRKYAQTKVERVKNLKQVISSIEPLVSPVIFSFIRSQLISSSVSKYGHRWSVSDKNLCLQLYLSSPKAYNTLKRFLNLPSKPTLLKIVSGIKMEPGFSTAVLNSIKLIASKLKPHDKYCIISFDEMSLKCGLVYNKKKDKIVGFEDYGSQIQSSSSKLATHALSFMVRGLCKKWKQIVGFFFSSQTAPAATLKILLTNLLRELIQCGMTPIAVVCDQGANNLKLYAKEWGVTVDCPYFTVDNVNVYTFFDVPHLLKSLRNNFKKYPVHFNGFKSAVWSHVASLYEFDSKQDHRSVPKLTQKHIEVDGLSAMNVKLAAQVLSQSVAAGICTLSTFGYLPPSAKHTADFCSTVNKLFDSLNSRTLIDKTNSLKSAVTKTSSHINRWAEFFDFIKSIEFQTKGKKINFPCLWGWQITLSAAMKLVPRLLDEVPFILMCRFHQDAIENFFSVVRRRGGNNDHPTACDFQQRARMLIAQNIFSSCGMTNCEPDHDTVLIPTQLLTEIDDGVSEVAGNSEIAEFTYCEGESGDIPCFPFDGKSLSANGAAYFAGFVAKKTCKKFECETCHQLLMTDKNLAESSLLLYLKEFDDVKYGLTYPTQNLVMTFCELGQKFTALFSEISHEQNVKKKIVSSLRNVNHEWLSCATHASDVWNYIVNYYSLVMIYYKVKALSKDIPNRKKSLKKIAKLT